MAESWLFVENVPVLCDEKGIEKQLKVETWLFLDLLLKELKNTDPNKKSPKQAMSYVV